MFYVHLRGKYILLRLGGMFCICLLHLFGLKFGSSPASLCWCSVWMISPLLKVRYWISLLLLYYCLSLPSDLLGLLNIFHCSDTGCIYIYDCSIFLMNWPLYIMTFLSLVTIFGLKYILYDISIATSALFCFPFSWSIIFHCFALILFVLKSKVSLL